MFKRRLQMHSRQEKDPPQKNGGLQNSVCYGKQRD